MLYPARFTPDTDDGGFVVTFRDLPEVNTQGDTLEETIEMATDALVTVMDFYFDDRRAVPAPSAPLEGEQLIELPASVAAKVLLLNAMVADHVSNVDLAHRMGTRPQEVQRIVDLKHATKIDTIAAALRALGRRLEMQALV